MKFDGIEEFKILPSHDVIIEKDQLKEILKNVGDDIKEKIEKIGEESVDEFKQEWDNYIREQKEIYGKRIESVEDMSKDVDEKIESVVPEWKEDLKDFAISIALFKVADLAVGSSLALVGLTLPAWGIAVLASIIGVIGYLCIKKYILEKKVTKDECIYTIGGALAGGIFAKVLGRLLPKIMTSLMGKEIVLSAEKNVVKPIVRSTENMIPRLSTINSDLVGQLHAKTGILYREVKIVVDGVEKIGVFPKFESIYTTKLPDNLLKCSRSTHFEFCSKNLGKAIENNQSLRNKFTERQLTQINMGAPKIDKLTWHHNEQTGVMELVDESVHEMTRHTGGYSIWGPDKI